jgi:hypothetical protein
MNATDLKSTSTDYPQSPAMFSLAELDSHYVVAVDIPTIPLLSPEILTSKGELTLEGESTESHEPQTVLRLLPKGKNIKTVYKNGVLWLLLPKFNVKSLTEQATAAAI